MEVLVENPGHFSNLAGMNGTLFHWLEEHLLPCPVKMLTGHDCPGCGMQRALLSLFKGDFVQSMQYHPAAIPTIVMLIFLVLHLRFRFRMGARVLMWMYILIAGITFVNFIFRLVNPSLCQ